MILKRYTHNNGYRCSCCSSTVDDTDWIEEEEMLTFEQMLDKAYDFKENVSSDWGLVSLQYERDGKILYGYNTDFSKTWTEVTIDIGIQTYRIVADGCDDYYYDRETIMEIWRDNKQADLQEIYDVINNWAEEEISNEGQIEKLVEAIRGKFNLECEYYYAGGFDSPGYDIDCYVVAFIYNGKIECYDIQIESY